MTLQIQNTASTLKIVVGLITIFGVIGFTASVINVFYTKTVNFDFVWLSVSCMIIGMIILGVMRK